MKQSLKIALGVVLLSAGLTWGQSVWRGDMNLINDHTGTSQYQVGGADIISSMSFSVDSLGADQTIALFTPPRAITFKTMDVFAGTAMATDSATVSLLSTGNTFIGWLPTSATYEQNDLTDVTFPAGVVCTLKVEDQTGGTGGIGATITLWYTDE